MRRAKNIRDDGPVADAVEGGRALHRRLDAIFARMAKHLVNVAVVGRHRRRDYFAGTPVREDAKRGRQAA